jgi:hypothetical protein
MNHIPEHVKFKRIPTGHLKFKVTPMHEGNNQESLKRWSVLAISCLIFSLVIGATFISGALYLKEIVASALLINIPLYLRASNHVELFENTKK